MKKIFVYLGAVLVFGFVVNSMAKPNLPFPRLTKTVALNKVAVVVNNSVITKQQINQGVAVAKQQLLSRGVPIPATTVLQRQVIDSLINRALLLQIVKRANITVSSSKVDAALRSIAAQNHMGLTQLKQSLEAQGGSYSQFRQRIKEQLQFQQVFQSALAGNVTVTRAEVSAFIRQHGSLNKEYHLARILVTIPDSPTSRQISRARSKAEGLLKKIKSGAKFQGVAASQSSGSDALNGGDLGWKTLAQLPTLYVKAIKKMKEGSVAGPLQAANGFHIIKLLKMQTGKTKLSKAQVENMIFQQKMAEQQQAWLRKMRSTAYIKHF